MRYTYSITYKKPELDTITPSTVPTTPPTAPHSASPSPLNRKNMRYTITHGMPMPSSDDTVSPPPPTISITPPATPSPSSSLTLTPLSHLPFRSLRAHTPFHPLLRKRPRPAAPLIFPASMWRDACPTEPPAPLRASFPFHMPPIDLTIDTVLANATPQVLHVSAPRRADFDRCSSAWHSGSLAKSESLESLDSLMDKFAALAARRQRRREGSIRHAQPAPYLAEERYSQSLLRHKKQVQAVHASLAALELAMKKAEEKLEDLERSHWYQDADVSSMVVEDGEGDDESAYEWLLVSDAGDGDCNDAEPVESGEDDQMTGFEKLVGIVAEDSDGEMTLERLKSFEILGSLL